MYNIYVCVYLYLFVFIYLRNTSDTVVRSADGLAHFRSSALQEEKNPSAKELAMLHGGR